MLTKRQKITISTILLSLGLFAIPVVDPKLRIYFLGSLVLGSYLLSVWSIFQELAGFEFVTLFVLPVLLTLSFGLFIRQYNPIQELRLLLAFVYGAALYTILLAENIFNVSAERNIPLIRAARTVGYLVTLFVALTFFSLFLSFGLDWWLIGLITFVVGFLLFAQALWQIELDERLSGELITHSLVAGLVMAELAVSLAFWPLDPAKVGLALTAMVYVMLGILQHMVKKDLNRRTALEYVFLSFCVFLFLILTTSWGI